MKICLSLKFAIAHIFAIPFLNLGECQFTPTHIFQVANEANKCGVGRQIFENGLHYPHYDCCEVVPENEKMTDKCDRESHLRGVKICLEKWKCFYSGSEKRNITGFKTDESRAMMDLSEILCRFHPCYETAMHNITVSDDPCDLWSKDEKLLNMSEPVTNNVCRNKTNKFELCAASLKKMLDNMKKSAETKVFCKCAQVDDNMTMNFIQATVAFDLNKQILTESVQSLNHMPECNALLNVDQTPPPFVTCFASTAVICTLICFSDIFVIISFLLCSYSMNFLMV